MDDDDDDDFGLSREPIQRITPTQFEVIIESGYYKRELLFHLFGTYEYELHPAFIERASEVICGTTWGKGGIAFRCVDCEKDQNCVICTACFFDSEAKHANHRVKLIRTTGGCCDCGDISSWNENGFCSRHGPRSSVANHHLSISQRDSAILTENAFVLFRYIVETICQSVTMLGNQRAAKHGLDFLLECAQLSFFEPIVMDSLHDGIISLWVEVCCTLGGRLFRPNGPVQFSPSMDECAEISSAFANFFLSLVQRNAQFKIRFTKHFLNRYGEIVKLKVMESDEEATGNGDLSSLSVQLFTIPEVCESLLDTLLLVLLQNLNTLMATVKDSQTGQWSVREMRRPVEAIFWRVIHDLGYTLHHDKVCEYFLEHQELIDLLIACIKPIQHANVQSIKHGDHVIYENVMWRSISLCEQLFATAISPLIEYVRGRPDLAELFITRLVANMEPFDLLKHAGENASFHFPLIQILVNSINVKTLVESPPQWISILTPQLQSNLLLESLRPLLLSREIANDVWIRNGEVMRMQRDVFLQRENDAVTGVCMSLILMSKTSEKVPVVELFRSIALLLADIPDDYIDESLPAQHRISRLSDMETFGPDQVDSWMQLFIRDCIIGGRGNSVDLSRRKVTIGFICELLCRITSDNSYSEFSQLCNRMIDLNVRKRLLKRCLVQRIHSQRLPFSKIVGLVPLVLRQPESMIAETLNEIAARDGATGSYMLSAEGLRLLDACHRTFGTDQHALEEAASKQEQVLGQVKSDKGSDVVRDALIASLMGGNALLLRFLSSLLRARLCEIKSPGCLEAAGYPPPEISPQGMDSLIMLFCYKTIDNLRSSPAGLVMLKKASEANECWKRPVFGVRMILKDLIQRNDLNGLSGIYFGQQSDRYCITMHHHGKLLVKGINTSPGEEVIDSSKRYAETIQQLLEEILLIPANLTFQICAKAAKDLAERLAESTGVVTHQGTPQASASVVLEDEEVAKMRSSRAKQRQTLLLQRMQQKQSRFTVETRFEEEQEHRGQGNVECAMCRESGLDSEDDLFVAIGFCAGGNAIGRTAVRGSSMAFPAAPYMNACLHTVHMSCWQSHLEASAHQQRGPTDFLFLNRPLDGEVQCPVCRSLSNVVIPLIQGETTQAVCQAIVDLGDRILQLTRTSSTVISNNDLWLARDTPCYRPFLFNSSLDAFAEATYNELLLSISLTPSRVLASTSLHSLLVRCMMASLKGTTDKEDWKVWDRDRTAAARVDCARLFLESGFYNDRQFMKDLLCLRYLQLEDSASATEKMTHLGVLMAWIVASVEDLSSTDLNRIAFLADDPKTSLAVVEQVLGVTGWQTGLDPMRNILSWATYGIKPGCYYPNAQLVKVNLPEKLTDLIKLTVNRTCENCKTAPSEPAVCLVCNEVVCLECDRCKSESGEGECTQHAKKCGAGQGMFILPYASVVVAVGNPRNAIWDGPYVDSHDETDSYLKRSCQLRLCQNKLDQMRLAFTRGSIPIEIVKQNQITGRYVPRQL
jgi:hypothetical protein